MALPKDPTLYPPSRWSLHSVYQPLPFSPAYLETLQAMQNDPHGPVIPTPAFATCFSA